jgi:hypothetical protein
MAGDQVGKVWIDDVSVKTSSEGVCRKSQARLGFFIKDL